MINDDTTSLTYEVKSIYPRQQRRTILKDFKDKNHSLQKNGLVEIEKQSSLFGEDIKLLLTDIGKEKLLGDDAALYKIILSQTSSCSHVIKLLKRSFSSLVNSRNSYLSSQ
jgi:hypothetical protein